MEDDCKWLSFYFFVYFEGSPPLEKPIGTTCCKHIDQSIFQDYRSVFHVDQQQHFALSACNHIKTWKTMFH
jgi:hypothetical protein